MPGKHRRVMRLGQRRLTSRKYPDRSAASLRRTACGVVAGCPTPSAGVCCSRALFRPIRRGHNAPASCLSHYTPQPDRGHHKAAVRDCRCHRRFRRDVQEDRNAGSRCLRRSLRLAGSRCHRQRSCRYYWSSPHHAIPPYWRV